MEFRENKKTMFVIGLVSVAVLIVLIAIVCKFVFNIGGSRDGANVSYESGYESLKELGETDYESMSLKAFNDYIMQHYEGKPYTFQKVMQTVKDKVDDADENSSFIKKTLGASLSELYPDKKTPYLPFSMTVPYTDFKEGSKEMKITGAVYYEVNAADQVRVSYRDETLEKLMGKVENCANQMFLPEFTKESIRDEIESHFEEWQSDFSNELISFHVGLSSVEIQ